MLYVCAMVNGKRAIETLPNNNKYRKLLDKHCKWVAARETTSCSSHLQIMEKTFVLNPLTEVFKCFISHASVTFVWVGAEKADLIFLNDLRWNDKLIPWADCLNFLEGLPIHIQAPKTHFGEYTYKLLKNILQMTSCGL